MSSRKPAQASYTVSRADAEEIPGRVRFAALPDDNLEKRQ
jgi:hypothetical protein